MTTRPWQQRLGINPDPCSPADDKENLQNIINTFNELKNNSLTVNNANTNLDEFPYNTINISDGSGTLGFGGNFGWIFRNDDTVCCPSRALLRIIGTNIGDDADSVASPPSIDQFTAAGNFYKIARPNTSFKRRYGINAWVDVPAGEFGIGCFLHTPGYLMIDGGTDGDSALDEEWGATPSEWYAKKNRPGFVMTGPGIGFGARVLTAPLCGQRFYLAPGGFKYVETVVGKTSGNVSSGGSDTITVWAGASIGTLATTGQTIADAENWGPAITTGVTFVNVSWPHGKPVFVKRCT